MSLVLIGLLSSCSNVGEVNPRAMHLKFCDSSVDADCNSGPGPEPVDCEGGCYEQSQDKFPLRSDERKRRDDRKSEAFAIIPAAITLRLRTCSEKDKKQRDVATGNARKHRPHPDVRPTKHIGRNLSRYHSSRRGQTW